MTAHAQQRDFSARLVSVLPAAGLKVSPTQVSRAFNAASGEAPISVHACRKWLVGEAIPTQARILTLARMLGVEANWLRFGDGLAGQTAPELSVEDNLLLAAVARLGAVERRAVLQLAHALGGAA